MYALIALIGSFALLWTVFAWLACAFFCGHLAGEKNRGGFSWFCLGILFGPLALIAAAGLPDNRTGRVRGTFTDDGVNKDIDSVEDFSDETDGQGLKGRQTIVDVETTKLAVDRSTDGKPIGWFLLLLLAVIILYSFFNKGI